MSCSIFQVLSTRIFTLDDRYRWLPLMLLNTCFLFKSFNTCYLSDSYIIFTHKMESVSKNTIFDLKLIVKSGLEKIFLKFLHVGDYFPCFIKVSKITNSVIKITIFPHGVISKRFFLDLFSLSFLGQKLYF